MQKSWLLQQVTHDAGGSLLGTQGSWYDSECYVTVKRLGTAKLEEIL